MTGPRHPLAYGSRRHRPCCRRRPDQPRPVGQLLHHPSAGGVRRALGASARDITSNTRRSPSRAPSAGASVGARVSAAAATRARDAAGRPPSPRSAPAPPTARAPSHARARATHSPSFRLSRSNLAAGGQFAEGAPVGFDFVLRTSRGRDCSRSRGGRHGRGGARARGRRRARRRRTRTGRGNDRERGDGRSRETTR